MLLFKNFSTKKMTLTHTLAAISCYGYEAFLTDDLRSFDNLKSIDVDLDSFKASIDKEQLIKVEIFQREFSDIYSIKILAVQNEYQATPKQVKEVKVRSNELFHLLSIFGNISTTKILSSILILMVFYCLLIYISK